MPDGARASTTRVPDVLGTSGDRLSGGARSFFESRFGHDFSGVRLHTDTAADASARSLGARAYTVGEHIVFGRGQYDAGSAHGRQLLAHELTHVLQQRAAPVPSTQAMLEVGPVDDPLEREADRVAQQVTGAPAPTSATRSPVVFTPAPAGTAQRVQRLASDGVESTYQQRDRGGTLPYREATELADCVRIMGEANADYCRQQVLGEDPQLLPRFTQVPGISSPQPRGTHADAAGATHFDVGHVALTFLPDDASTDPAMANRAETHIQIARGAIHYVTDGRGRITSFTGPGTAQATVRTTFGPGATAIGSSGYGRGTTAADRAGGDTSLGFHEGRHGVDYQDYLAAHPFPTFGGTRGMTEAAFKNAMTGYLAAVAGYSTAINDYSLQRTDCVGFTIDQSNAAAAANGAPVQAALCRRPQAGAHP